LQLNVFGRMQEKANRVVQYPPAKYTIRLKAYGKIHETNQNIYKIKHKGARICQYKDQKEKLNKAKENYYVQELQIGPTHRSGSSLYCHSLQRGVSAIGLRGRVPDCGTTGGTSPCTSAWVLMVATGAEDGEQ